MKKRIAIIGGGPSGSTLAALLSQRGFSVVLYDDDRTPDLLVGESLIPGVVPILRELGIEEQVAEIGTYKPGVSFVRDATDEIRFTFAPVRKYLPPYSYNVPRPQFDKLVAKRARELGVEVVSERGEIERDAQGNPCLSQRSLAASQGLGGEKPDLLVDASGRSRRFARLMDLPARQGTRKDVSYFAHFEDFEHPEEPGHVIITRLEHGGWSWRIPLKDCLSVGIVIDKEKAKALGDTPEERLENAIRRDPIMGPLSKRANRISKVPTYTNYQLISDVGYGRDWVLLGDAFGFVDPMLSSGLFMALKSAEILANELGRTEEMERACGRYITETETWLESWMELVEYFYDGRIFSLHESGQKIAEFKNPLAKLMQRHTEKHIACMASGAFTTKRYSRGMLKFLSGHLLWGVRPPEEASII